MRYASAAQMAELDHLSVNVGLSVIQMMELAGHYLPMVADKIGCSPQDQVAIICGKGNKAGDGLSGGRHLLNQGYTVRFILTETEDKLSAPARLNLRLLRSMGANILLWPEPEAKTTLELSTLIIDALVGYNLRGAPRGAVAEITQTVAGLSDEHQVIAYDIPTGIDSTSGETYSPYISAKATIMLAMPKLALKRRRRHFGAVFLADLGIPNSVYREVFAEDRPSFPPTGLIKL